MSNTLSRRRWLCCAAIASATATLAHGQSPITATPAVATSTELPIQSRAIQLQDAAGNAVVVTAIAVDPRGELVAVACADHEIRILHSSNLTAVKQLQGHRDLIRTLAFDPAGNQLASAGNDGQLILWNRQEQFAITQRMEGTPALARVRFAPDGREMAAVGFDNAVYILGRGGQQRPIFDCDCKDLRAVAYRDDAQVIAVAGRSGDLHLFDCRSGRLLGEHALHQGRIHDVVFHHSSNQAICVAEDGIVTVFDTAAARLRHRIEIPNAKLFAAAVINSQAVAVAGSDNTIRIVNTDHGQVVRTLHGHQGSVSTLAAGGGLLFSGSYDATLRRWSLGELDAAAQRIAEKDPPERG